MQALSLDVQQYTNFSFWAKKQRNGILLESHLPNSKRSGDISIPAKQEMVAMVAWRDIVKGLQLLATLGVQ